MKIRQWIPAAAIAIVASNGPVYAVDSNERGKKSLVKLFGDVVAKATDATVRVRCSNKDTILGTIVDKKGYILTKGSELKGPISIRLRDGSEYDAVYVGYHEPSDLALLKIDATDIATIAAFAPGKDATVGNWVAAVGFESEPVGVGIISAGVRKLYREESFVENGNKGFLGIIAGLPSEGKEQVLIGEVDPKGSAYRAKLAKGDIILEIAGTKVKKFEEMKKLLDDYKPGDTIKMTVLRGEEEKEFNVKLGSRADIDRGAFQNAMGSLLSGRRTGFPSVIMHDMVIKPSDCGGPLVDLDGKVLGINIARAGRVETWALPAEVVTPILKELIDGKFPPPGKRNTEKVNKDDK